MRSTVTPSDRATEEQTLLDEIKDLSEDDRNDNAKMDSYIRRLIEGNFHQLLSDKDLFFDRMLEASFIDLNVSSIANSPHMRKVTMLYYAIFYSQPDIVKALIARGIEVKENPKICGPLQWIASLVEEQPNDADKQALVEIANLLLQTPQYDNRQGDFLPPKHVAQLSREGVKLGPYIRLNAARQLPAQWTTQLELESRLRPDFRNEGAYFNPLRHLHRVTWHLSTILCATVVLLPATLLSDLILVPLVATMYIRKTILGYDRHLSWIDCLLFLPLLSINTVIMPLVATFCIAKTLGIAIVKNTFRLVLAVAHLLASAVTLLPYLINSFYNGRHTKFRQANAKKLPNTPDNPQAIHVLIDQLTPRCMHQIAAIYATKHRRSDQQSLFQSRSSYYLRTHLAMSNNENTHFIKNEIGTYMGSDKNRGKALYCTIFKYLHDTQRRQVDEPYVPYNSEPFTGSSFSLPGR